MGTGSPIPVAVRSPRNPLITLRSGDIGPNINGPSVIAVPEWCDSPLGAYYMYFADHGGTYIRLAHAEHPEGPWTIHDQHVLPVEELEPQGYYGHIASPDVHVDHERQAIILFFHAMHPWPEEAAGRLRTTFGQLTGVAESTDGLAFTSRGDVPLAFSYLRTFRWQGMLYGLTARALVFQHDRPGWPDGTRTLVEREAPLGSWRHCAVHVSGDRLFVFYTRWGDCPERVVASYIDLRADWNEWRLSPAALLLKPEKEIEGAHLSLVPSTKGAAREPLNQLRDPCFFRDGKHDYLYYSIAGESGISVSRLVDDWERRLVQAIEEGHIDPADSDVF